VERRPTASVLQTALNSEDMRVEAGLIIRTLIDEIVLTPLEGRRNIDIKIVGDLAAILGLAATTKNTSTNAGVMKWLVARVGNAQEPTLRITRNEKSHL
jgi:site-specific DNA recombinase